MPLVPRSQWRTFQIFTPQFIKDQDAIGACASFASTSALEGVRLLQGNNPVEFSGGQLYGRVNGGVDAGSTLEDNLRELQLNGAVPVEYVGHLDWQPRRWPRNWRDLAKDYRVLEAWDCPSFEEIVSAILRGYPVVYGIFIGTNFVVQSDGWVARKRGSGGGHAMLGYGVVVERNRTGILTLNSWGARWGINGSAIVPEDYFASWTDAFAVRSAIYA